MLNIISIFLFISFDIFFPFIGHVDSFKKERDFFNLMTNDVSQQRETLVLSSVLSNVSRAHSCDMIKRNFFEHINPDGVGSNFRVLTAGIELPEYYSRAVDANNIESIAAGYDTPEKAYMGLKTSPRHRNHVLGIGDFYSQQIIIGIGICYSQKSKYGHYYTITTIPLLE
jgi:uncharacterized protein YkwD